MIEIIRKAWDKLYARPELVQDSFIHIGIYVNLNSLEDFRIQIKDYKDISFNGWKDRVTQVIKQKLKEKHDNVELFDIKTEAEHLEWRFRAHTCNELRLELQQRGL